MEEEGKNLEEEKQQAFFEDFLKAKEANKPNHP